MGTFSKTVKKVESDIAIEKTAVAGDAAFDKALSDQTASMNQMVESPSESAFNSAVNATKYIAGGGIGVAGVLALLRYLEERKRDKRVLDRLMGKSEYSTEPDDDKMQLPIGEKSVAVKFASDKQAGINDSLVALGDQISGAAGSGWRKIKDLFGDIVSPVRGQPQTHWAGIPMMFGGGALATLGGSALFDAVLDKMRDKRRQREVEDAEDEFQSALATQYSSKESSIHNMIDGLSKAHASGELKTQLQGFNKIAGAGALPTGLGFYLAALMFLAGSGAYHGYSSSEEGDTKRRRSEALERALTRRGAATPPQFILERPNEMDEEPV